jgi:FAD/FMN-containing dehydrogenase
VLFFLSWPWSSAARVISGWQQWAPNAPDALWSNLHLSAAPRGGTPVLGVGGTYVGTAAAAQGHLSRLYELAGSDPSSTFVRENSYLEAMLVEAGCSGLTVPQCHTGPGGELGRQPSYAKSDFFTKPLSAAAISALLGRVERMTVIPGAAGASGSVAFDALGGAVNRVHPEATAFVHRNALFVAQYYTSWTWPGSSSGVARQREWLRATHAAMGPYASGQAYQNYIDPDLTNWQHAYYGENYPRLASIKARYDPDRLFNFPQAIAPS